MSNRTKTRTGEILHWMLAVLIVCTVFGAGNPPVIHAQAAAGTTYYVNKTNKACSDSGPGTQSSPFCTIGAGAAVAVAGDTVSVLAGTYAETVRPANSGVAGQPITFTAASGVKVTGLAGNSTSGGAFRLFQKSYIVIDEFTVTGTADYGIIATSSKAITLTNNHVSYSGKATSDGTLLRPGIYLTATTDSFIIGNTTDHNTFDGIRLNNGSNNNWVEGNTSFGNATQISTQATGIALLKNSNNNTLIRNITYANEDSGMNFFTGSSHNTVINNLSYGNADHGIDNNGAPYNVFIGNTVQGNVTVGINLEKDSSGNGSGGATLLNNISVDNGYRLLVGGGTFTTSNSGNLRVDLTSITSPAATTLDYDQIYSSVGGVIQVTWGTTTYTSLAAFQSNGQEAHGLQANPLFQAPAPVAQKPPAPPYIIAENIGDYHLTDGSPAIDSANSGAPNEQSTDIEGYPRVDDPATANTGAGPRTYDDRGAYEFHARQAQSITVGTHAPADAPYDTIFNVAAAASSGLPVTYSASGVCTNSGAKFTLTSGTGTCTIHYNQAGNAYYAAAPEVTEDVSATRQDQAITFGAPDSPAAYHDTFMVTPTSDSGLVVTVTAAGACSIAGSTVTMTSGTGTCSLTASQAGNANYIAAASVVQAVVAQKAAQAALLVTGPASLTYGTTRTIGSSGGSGTGARTYAQGSSTGCAVQASTGVITVTDATGSCIVTVNKAADDNYQAASSAEFGITLKKAAGSVSINNIPGSAFFGGSFTPAFTTSGDGSTAVHSHTTSTCTVTAGVVNFAAPGTCTLQATVTESTNYLAATGALQSFSIAKASQTIIINKHAPARAADNTTFNVAASSSSGLLVAYGASGACTRNGAVFTITSSTGKCTVHYNQTGNANYAAAPEITEVVNIQPQSYLIFLPQVLR